MANLYRTFIPGVEVVWRWEPYFTPDEFRCQGTGDLLVCPRFMDRLVRVRIKAGFAFPVNSGYRAPTHNQQVSSTGLTGPHTGGKLPPDIDPATIERGAVDIGVLGGKALALIGLASEEGFSGIGVKQKGPHSGRFIHLDNLPDAPGQPRPWVWSY